MVSTVSVIGAPGYENFLARPIPGLGVIDRVDGRGPLRAVVDTDREELYVVPARCVMSVQAYHYARQWSMMTGRPMSDVYIPEALR